MFTTIAQERNATAPFWMKVSREARLESFKFALKRATSFTSSGCLARSSLVMAVPCSSFLSSSFRLSDSVDYLGKSPPLTSFQFSCTTSALSFCLVYASHDWDRQTPLIVRLLTVMRFFYSVTCNSETLTFWNIIYGYLENNTVCRLDNGTLNRIREISVVHPSTKRSVFWMSQWYGDRPPISVRPSFENHMGTTVPNLGWGPPQIWGRRRPEKLGYPHK